MNQKNKADLHVDVEFRNLGRIQKANIQLRPFTVIAGCNSSGKSFITKSLYSLFSFNPAIEEDKNLPNALQQQLELLEEQQQIIKFLKKEKLVELDKIDQEELIEQAQKSNNNFEKLLKLLSSNNKKEKTISNKELSELPQNFLDNFMIQHLGRLINFQSKKASINIKNIGKFEISKKLISINPTSFDRLRLLNLHPPIYLESPTYWKLSDALKNAKNTLMKNALKRGLTINSLVSQAPKYFFDVLELLEEPVKNTAFDDIIEMLEKAINGNLSISNGNIHFNDNANNQTIGLSLTALGVTNVGMLALLLKQGAILPGTFLFIDEPEVHLHPSWQVLFVQALYKLSKRGVNVVIASHSIDIMKAIENLMEKDENQQNHFGINQLSQDGNSIEDSVHNLKRIAAISEDLGNPFYEMMMEGWTLE